MSYTITEGTRPGALEVYFEDKPSKGTLAALKVSRFKYNFGKKCWYGYETRQHIESILLDDAAFALLSAEI